MGGGSFHSSYSAPSVSFFFHPSIHPPILPSIYPSNCQPQMVLHFCSAHPKARSRRQAPRGDRSGFWTQLSLAPPTFSDPFWTLGAEGWAHPSIAGVLVRLECPSSDAHLFHDFGQIFSPFWA